ncbi:MAG: hypothetical protein Q7S50_01325 [bacterium]|nr:hypothetical protein [bacterium]
MKANPKKVGLVLGTMLGGVHVLWSLLVFLGWAQPLVNFSLWAHMVQAASVIGPFDITAAVTVVIVACLVGYAIGYAAGTVWNKVHE